MFEQGTEFCGEEHEAVLAFVVNVGAAAAHGVGGDEAEFADADACGGDGLQDQGKAMLSRVFCCLHEALIFCMTEFFVFVAEKGALNFQGLDEKVAALMVFEVAINGGQECVDGGGGVVLHELVFPGDEQGFVERAVGGGFREDLQGVAILGDGAGAAFFVFEGVDVLLDAGCGEDVWMGGHGGFLLLVWCCGWK